LTVATASTIQFDNIKTVGLTNVAQGVQQASRSTLTVAELNAATKYEENFGGRQYVATLTDKNGKTAPEGTVVYVNIKDAGNNNPTTVKVFDLNDKNLAAAPKAAGQAGQTYALKTDKNGQIVCRVYCYSTIDNVTVDEYNWSCSSVSTSYCECCITFIINC